MNRLEPAWFGSLASGWREVRIRDHFHMIYGFPYQSDLFNKNGDGYPVIRIRDLLDRDLPTFYSGRDGLDVVVRNGDLVIGMDGDFNCVQWSRGEALLNQRVCALRPRYRSQIEPRFLFYQLSLPLKLINDVTPSSTVKHISGAQILSQRVPIPDRTKQVMIATFLEAETARIDTLIEKKQRFLELIEEKRVALASMLVDGSISDTSGSRRPGWWGEAPAGWHFRRAKFLFQERELRSSTGEEELLSVSHLTGVSRRADKAVNMFLAETNEGYKLVRESDVVVNTMWAWMGAMGVSAMDGLVSPSYAVYRLGGDDFIDQYIDILLRSRPFVAEVNRRSKGVWSSRLRLYPDAFLDIVFPVPPRADQARLLDALARTISREYALGDLARTSVDRLREFRAALITAAVTGQIDPAEWRRRGQADRRLEEIEVEMSV